MDKHAIVAEIIRSLTGELTVITDASREAREAATHEDNRAEDKYDTRATESSYLADGQAKLAAEMKEALELFRGLEPRVFSPHEPIAVGALVTLRNQRGGRDVYFLGPRGGGLSVTCGGVEIMVITPHSPIGRKMLGRSLNETITLDGGAKPRLASIVAIE